MQRYSGQRDRVLIFLEQDIQAHGFVYHVDIDDLDFQVFILFQRNEPGGNFQQLRGAEFIEFQFGPDLGEIAAVELIDAQDLEPGAIEHIVN